MAGSETEDCYEMVEFGLNPYEARRRQSCICWRPAVILEAEEENTTEIPNEISFRMDDLYTIESEVLHLSHVSIFQLFLCF